MDFSSPPRSLSAFGRVKQMLSPKRKEQIEEKRVNTNDSDSELSTSCCSGADDTNLKAVFNHFDEDKDGKLSGSELISCVKTVGGDLSIEEAEAAVKSSDLNGDGVIDFHEFHTLMETSSGSEEEKKTELKQAFGIYDMEGCGVITAEGLKRMLSRLGESRTINDCKAMIRAFDLNDDGVLSFNEFLVMMR